ncbi:MAG: lytic transglycosylase domain-containing protein [Myxococcota bacterium]
MRPLLVPLAVIAATLACANPSPSTSPAPPPPDAAPVAVDPAPPAPTAPAIDLTVPRDPALLASRLLDAERAIRDPAVDDATAAAWGHLQQRIYRVLADDGVLAGAVTASIPPALSTEVNLALTGTRQIGKTVIRPKLDLPDWRIVDPKPAAELLGYYREAGAAYDLPWTALASIHLNETRTGRLRGLSDVGAQGPMQFMPETWAKYGAGDVENDRDAIFAAAKYLDAMGWHADRRKAIWAYNHSEAYIDAILAFAEIMDRDERAYRGLWGWQVYYRTVQGSIWLATGYAERERIPIEAYCAPRGEPYCPKVHP